MIDSGEGLVRVAEVARRLGVCRSTVYMLLEAGEMPYVQIGGTKRVPRGAIEAYIRDNMIAGIHRD